MVSPVLASLLAAEGRRVAVASDACFLAVHAALLSRGLLPLVAVGEAPSFGRLPDGTLAIAVLPDSWASGGSVGHYSMRYLNVHPGGGIVHVNVTVLGSQLAVMALDSAQAGRTVSAELSADRVLGGPAAVVEPGGPSPWSRRVAATFDSSNSDEEIADLLLKAYGGLAEVGKSLGPSFQFNPAPPHSPSPSGAHDRPASGPAGIPGGDRPPMVLRPLRDSMRVPPSVGGRPWPDLERPGLGPIGPYPMSIGPTGGPMGPNSVPLGGGMMPRGPSPGSMYIGPDDPSFSGGGGGRGIMPRGDWQGPFGGGRLDPY